MPSTEASGENAIRLVKQIVNRSVSSSCRGSVVLPQAFVLSLNHVEEGVAAPFSMDAPGLARALAATPGWENSAQAVIVTRKTPSPQIAVMGFFSAPEQERLERLPGRIKMGRRNLRYIGYGQAEKDCESLAQHLIERFGKDTIAGARFVAIPRGGLIVLSMLSYYLDLKPNQLSSNNESDTLLVVVDDCTLSGSRFRETLQQHPDASEIVFAHLYSNPELRRAIECAEPRVSACVSAHDLEDHAPDEYGEDYAAWRTRWAERSGKRTYWTGKPDRVCFPWTEPDINIWNEGAGRSEYGWRVVPPEFCLKNRVALTHGPDVFIQPEGIGPLRPALDVLYGPLEDRILIARTGSEHCVDLQGTAADMWKAIVTQGSAEEAHKALLEAYDVDSERLRTDLEQFIEELLENKLLVDSRAA